MGQNCAPKFSSCQISTIDALCQTKQLQLTSSQLTSMLTFFLLDHVQLIYHPIFNHGICALYPPPSSISYHILASPLLP